jgi:IS5 family transposase
MNEQLNEEVFSLLSNRINPKQERMVKSGRKGMGLWEILVLGVMRQGLNANYDRIHYFANADMPMRTVLGSETESSMDKKEYGLTTIKIIWPCWMNKPFKKLMRLSSITVIAF